MNDFPLIGEPSCAQRILGSPGGKHLGVARGKCTVESCFSLNKNDFEKRMTPFRRYFIRNCVEQS